MTDTIATVITEPGVYDLPDHIYHDDPVPEGSLSSSGARRLLPPSCPAKFAYERDNGRPPKKAFDIGHAAHREVLGIGADLVVAPFPDWRKDAARVLRNDAYAEGKTPILEAEYEVVREMAAALRRHPIAAALLDPERGQPEKSLFWQDERAGIWRRARLDWLPDDVSSAGRLLVPDYKTAKSADDEDFRKSAASYGYHQQAAWYLDAVRALGLCDNSAFLDAAFLFIVQETAAPYLVNVIELDTTALAIGAFENRRAINLFAECQRTGVWPGYGNEVNRIALPVWVERQYENEAIYS